MLRRSYLLFSILALMLAAGGSAMAQMEATSVRVETADTKAPVAGATIDLYRLDMAGKMTGTTDKDGSVTFPGTMAGVSYIIVASAPKFAPNFLPGVKAGLAGILIPLSVGDGRKVSEVEARNAVKTLETGEGGNLTPEQRAQILKEKANIAAVEVRNAKNKGDSEIASRLVDEGAAAFNANNYTLAIAKYDEGIVAVPDFIGITPRFYINKGISLKQRAVAEYRRMLETKDMPQQDKNDISIKVEKDLGDAATAFGKAWDMLKSSAATSPDMTKTVEGYREETITNALGTFRIAAQIKKVGEPVAIPAKAIIGGYLEQQNDAAKKAEATIVLADVLRQGGNYDASIAEYRKALALAPENPEALFGAALALIMGGTTYDDKGTEIKDKAKYQEAANYLAKFEPLAKGNPKYAEIAVEVPALVEVLKAADVVPVKETKTKVTTRKKT